MDKKSYICKYIIQCKPLVLKKKYCLYLIIKQLTPSSLHCIIYLSDVTFFIHKFNSLSYKLYLNFPSIKKISFTNKGLHPTFVDCNCSAINIISLSVKISFSGIKIEVISFLFQL